MLVSPLHATYCSAGWVHQAGFDSNFAKRGPPLVGAPAAQENRRVAHTGRADVVRIFVGADLRIKGLDCGRHCGVRAQEWTSSWSSLADSEILRRWKVLAKNGWGRADVGAAPTESRTVWGRGSRAGLAT